METSEYKNDFIEGYFRICARIGFEIGFEEGRVMSAMEKTLKVLDGFGLQPTDAQRAQVAGCTDLPQLDLWFDRALTAETAADVFED